MKILLSPIGTLGDIRPLISMGLHLKKMGHSISICSTEDWRLYVEKYSFPFYSIPINFRDLTSRNSWLMGKPLKSIIQFSRNLRELYDAQSDIISGIIKKFDCVIGTGLQLSAFSICEKYNIEYKHIVFSPNWMPSKFHTPPFLAHQFKSEFINQFAWRCFRLMLNFSVRSKINYERCKYNLPVITDVYNGLLKKVILSHCKIISSLPPDLASVQEIPYPDLIDVENALSSEVMHFISSGEKPIFMGFGSMPSENKLRTTELFIKVINSLGLRAIIDRGWANFNSEEKFENILFIDEEPHEKIFPFMKIIIHHGGAGTTLTATKSGNPQLIIPHLLDQFYWGERVKELKIAPPALPLKALSFKKLRNTLVQLLNDQTYPVNAKIISEKINNSNNENLCLENLKIIATTPS